MKTGVIQPLPGIGDMVWFQPALAALAAANGNKIALFAKNSAMAKYLFAADERIADIYSLPAKRGATAIISNFWYIWRVLRQAKLDRLYILHQSGKFRLAARLAGIRDIIAYPPDLARRKENGWIKSMAFLQQIGIPVTRQTSQLFVTPSSSKAVAERLAPYPRPWFMLPVGASEPARCWAPENFAACADALATKQGGTIFLTGSPREAAQVESIHNLCHAKNIVPLTDLPFDHFMALVATSTGVLGNDSGPANVAAALGKLSFMLCGISTPAIHSPNMIILRPTNATEGMHGISVTQVLTAIETIPLKN